MTHCLQCLDWSWKLVRTNIFSHEQNNFRKLWNLVFANSEIGYIINRENIASDNHFTGLDTLRIRSGYIIILLIIIIIIDIN